MTVGQYIRKRNGVPAGASGSLRNMLHRSLGAPSPTQFWQHWNPIFGFYLGRYIYAPLRRKIPNSAAFLGTFVASGALHDLVTMAVRGSVAFLFIPWFFLLALGVLLSRWAKMDLSELPWSARAGANLAYILTCLVGALGIRRALASYWTL